MDLASVLPEKWLEVAYNRRRKYRDAQLRLILDEGISVEKCLGCPMLRATNDTAYVYTMCLSFNKCIKQYPTYIDRKEFK